MCHSIGFVWLVLFLSVFSYTFICMFRSWKPVILSCGSINGRHSWHPWHCKDCGGGIVCVITSPVCVHPGFVIVIFGVLAPKVLMYWCACTRASHSHIWCACTQIICLGVRAPGRSHNYIWCACTQSRSPVCVHPGFVNVIFGVLAPIYASVCVHPGGVIIMFGVLAPKVDPRCACTRGLLMSYLVCLHPT